MPAQWRIQISPKRAPTALEPVPYGDDFAACLARAAALQAEYGCTYDIRMLGPHPTAEQWRQLREAAVRFEPTFA